MILPLRNHEFMNSYDKAKRIISTTEELSGLPVRVVWDDTLDVGAVVHLSEIDWAKQIRISVKPGRKDTDYLVGLQCAMAIRHVQNRDATKNLVSCEGSIEDTITEFTQLGYSQDLAVETAHRVIADLGRQLRGAAPQLVLATLIHREYPELRESQHVHHLLEVNTSYPSLKIDAKQFPDWILKSHQAMNGAFALATDYLFDRHDLFQPFKDAGYEKRCTQLLECVTSSDRAESDYSLVSKWMIILNLTEKFCWQNDVIK